MSALGLLLRHRDAALALIVAALILAIGLRAPVFVTPESLIGVLTDTSFLFMLTLAQMAVILTRGIDLSVAANLALTGMIAALVSRAMPGLPVAGIIVLAVALGAALGAVNGAFIALVGIPPIVVTLGTLSIYRGAIFLLAGGAWLTSKDMNPAFLAFPKLDVFGVPVLIVIAALVSLFFWALLNQSGPRPLCSRRQPGGRALLRHRSQGAAIPRLHARRRGLRPLRLSLGVALRHRLYRYRAGL